MKRRTRGVDPVWNSQNAIPQNNQAHENDDGFSRSAMKAGTAGRKARATQERLCATTSANDAAQFSYGVSRNPERVRACFWRP